MNTDMTQDMNNKAYNDVVDILPPQYPDDEEYMKYYRFWYAVDPGRFEL